METENKPEVMDETRLKNMIGLAFMYAKNGNPDIRDKRNLSILIVEKISKENAVGDKSIRNFFDKYFRIPNTLPIPGPRTVKAILSYLYSEKDEREIEQLLKDGIDYSLVPFSNKSESLTNINDEGGDIKKESTSKSKVPTLDKTSGNEKPFYFGIAAIVIAIVAIAALFFYTKVQIASDKNAKETFQINAEQIIVNTPQRIFPDKTTDFFTQKDEVNVWYATSGEGQEFFDAPGTHPTNGEILKPVTKELVARIKIKEDTTYTIEQEELTTKTKPIYESESAHVSHTGLESKNNLTIEESAIKMLSISILIFDSIQSIDYSVSRHIQSKLAKKYKIITNTIDVRALETSDFKNFANGSLKSVVTELNEKCDLVLIGNSNYTYGSIERREDMVKCTLDYSYQIISITTGEIVKSDNGILYGNGFSKAEAKSNTVKKLSL